MSNLEQIVIIKSHNDEKNISRCIESVLSQGNFEEIKLFIIDDASNDLTQKIIKSYKNYFYKMELRKVNLGASNNVIDYNKIIKNYNNGYVVILSGDDYLPLNKLSFHKSIFLQYDVGLHFGNGYVKNTNNDVLYSYPTRNFAKGNSRLINKNKNIFEDLIYENYIPSFASAYSLKYLNKINGFLCYPKNNLSVDFSTISRLSHVSKFYYSNQNLGFWVKSEGQQTELVREEQILLDFKFIKFYINKLFTEKLITKKNFKSLNKKSIMFKNYTYFNNCKKYLSSGNFYSFLKYFFLVIFKKNTLDTKIKAFFLFFLFPFPNIVRKAYSLRSTFRLFKR